MMKYRGHVKNGVVVLDQGSQLPEGATVHVAPVNGCSRNLANNLRKLAGRARNMPSDMARNHDHYLHGIRKKK